MEQQAEDKLDRPQTQRKQSKNAIRKARRKSDRAKSGKSNPDDGDEDTSAGPSGHYAGHDWAPPPAAPPIDNVNFPVLGATKAPISNLDASAAAFAPSSGLNAGAADFTPAHPLPGPTWAEQFGLHDIEPRCADDDIWLAPRFPYCHPERTGTVSKPVTTGTIPRPTPAELDILFSSEAIQRNRFAGLTTVEAQLFTLPPINTDEEEHLTGNWFNHNFHSDMIDTPFEEMLAVLQPPRWVAFRRHIDARGVATQGPIYEDNRHVWSWDNDFVANAVRPGLVLADRILKE